MVLSYLGNRNIETRHLFREPYSLLELSPKYRRFLRVEVRLELQPRYCRANTRGGLRSHSDPFAAYGENRVQITKRIYPTSKNDALEKKTKNQYGI